MPIRNTFKKIRRWFWEKVEGCQFHPLYSKCDEFTVRLQIRKKKSVSWEFVAYHLNKIGYEKLFDQKDNCTKDETRLIATWRERKGNHHFCQWGQKNKNNNWHIDLENKKTKEEIKKCLRKLAS